MRLTIEPTGEFFMAGEVMVRLWKGRADDGTPVSALVSAVRFEGEALSPPAGLVSIPPPSPGDMQRWAEAVIEGGELQGRGRGLG